MERDKIIGIIGAGHLGKSTLLMHRLLDKISKENNVVFINCELPKREEPMAAISAKEITLSAPLVELEERNKILKQQNKRRAIHFNRQMKKKF